MGLELAKAWVRIRGDASGLRQDLEGAKGEVEKSMGDMLGVIRGGLASIAGLSFFRSSLMLAGQFEQTQIAFDTMLGSAKETKDTLEDLTDFAAKTPFEMPEILQAARGLIQFGERGDDLMESLNLLGNAAAGTSTDFGLLALIFNQVRGVGKLLTQDFRQLSTRGVISLQDIADYFKVTTAEAQNMLSSGRISFEDLKGILKSLSEEGGRFFNLMEKQSQSLLGLLSTMKDAFGIISRVIGTLLMPAVKPLVSLMISLGDAILRVLETRTGQVLAGVISSVVLLTSALKALNVTVALLGITTARAMSMTGIGAIVVGVGLVIGLMAEYDLSMAQARDGTQAVGESAKSTAVAVDEMANSFASAMDEIDPLINKSLDAIKALQSALTAQEEADDAKLYTIGGKHYKTIKDVVPLDPMTVAKLAASVSDAKTNLTALMDKLSESAGDPLTQFKESLDALPDKFANIKLLLQNLLNDKSGFNKFFDDVLADIAKMKNDVPDFIDEARQKFKHLVPPEQMEALERALTEQESIKENQKKEKQNLDEQKRDAEMARKSLLNPFQKYSDAVKKNEDLTKANLLTEEERAKLNEDLKKQLDEDREKEAEKRLRDIEEKEKKDRLLEDGTTSFASFGQKIQNVLLDKDKAAQRDQKRNELLAKIIEEQQKTNTNMQFNQGILVAGDS